MHKISRREKEATEYKENLCLDSKANCPDKESTLKEWDTQGEGGT